MIDFDEYGGVDVVVVEEVGLCFFCNNEEED